VLKSGLFSLFAHDHHFLASDWRATAAFDTANPSEPQVEVVVSASSLRDEEPALSENDRDTVNHQAASPEVLDASRYPEIRFVSSSMRLAPRPSGSSDRGIEGVLAGTLSLHGRARPLSVPITATRSGETWQARGFITFKQSDFGIQPFSTAGGTVSVRDEVEIEYQIVLAPAS
jgi:polyisoprenoid-binding protein YceI